VKISGKVWVHEPIVETCQRSLTFSRTTPTLVQFLCWKEKRPPKSLLAACNNSQSHFLHLSKATAARGRRPRCSPVASSVAGTSCGSMPDSENAGDRRRRPSSETNVESRLAGARGRLPRRWPVASSVAGVSCRSMPNSASVVAGYLLRRRAWSPGWQGRAGVNPATRRSRRPSPQLRVTRCRAWEGRRRDEARREEQLPSEPRPSDEAQREGRCTDRLGGRSTSQPNHGRATRGLAGGAPPVRAMSARRGPGGRAAAQAYV